MATVAACPKGRAVSVRYNRRNRCYHCENPACGEDFIVELKPRRGADQRLAAEIAEPRDLRQPSTPAAHPAINVLIPFATRVIA